MSIRDAVLLTKIQVEFCLPNHSRNFPRFTLHLDVWYNHWNVSLNRWFSCHHWITLLLPFQILLNVHCRQPSIDHQWFHYSQFLVFLASSDVRLRKFVNCRQRLISKQPMLDSFGPLSSCFTFTIKLLIQFLRMTSLRCIFYRPVYKQINSPCYYTTL